MTISIARPAHYRLASAAAIAATLVTIPLATCSAVAADMPLMPRKAVVETPLWSGFYIGVHGGGGWGRSRLEDPLFQISFDPVFLKSNGWLAGAQVGADWQFGNFVIGGELAGSWGSIKGTNAPNPTSVLSGQSVDYRALATGTGRAGYAMGNLLGYAKGGVAWANIDYTNALASPAPIEVNHGRTGLTAGAGLEWLVLSNLSARLEYDYVYFGAAAISLGSRVPSNVDHELHLVKFGLNWRVSPDYIVARY